MITNPSRLACEASGLHPLGSRKASSETRCCMCGSIIHPGDHMDLFEPLNSFTNYPSLQAPQSNFACGYCLAIWRREFLQTYSKSVICREGIFPLASKENRAWWFLNPPEPPFLMVVGDQPQQHLVWRTPVSLSKELFTVRLGEKILTIRRDTLKRGLVAANALIVAINEHRASDEKCLKKNQLARSPFAQLDRNMERKSLHGMLSSEALVIAADNAAMKNEADILRNLTAGEQWALWAILYASEPIRPTPKVTPDRPIIA